MGTKAASPRAFLRPDLVLRSEALLFLVVEVLVYRGLLHGSWGWFAVLFLLPDVSLIPFAVVGGDAGRRALATGFYNLLHSYAPALVLGLTGFAMHAEGAERMALIWLAHISFDRVLGYGIKFPERFRFTHIQRCARIGEDGVAMEGEFEAV